VLPSERKSFIQSQIAADSTMTLEQQNEIESPRPAFRFINLKEVCGIFGFSRSTLYRRIDAGLIPPVVTFGGNFSRWVESEVQEVFQAMVAGWSEDQVRELVADLVEQRKQFKMAA
jgi:prophage regulatory protein